MINIETVYDSVVGRQGSLSGREYFMPPYLSFIEYKDIKTRFLKNVMSSKVFLFFCSFEECEFNDGWFEYSAITYAQIYDIKFHNTTFNRFEFNSIHMDEGLFENCVFRDVTFKDVCFFSVKFKNCKFENVGFVGIHGGWACYFQNTTLEDCALKNTFVEFLDSSEGGVIPEHCDLKIVPVQRH